MPGNTRTQHNTISGPIQERGISKLMGLVVCVGWLCLLKALVGEIPSIPGFVKPVCGEPSVQRGQVTHPTSSRSLPAYQEAAFRNIGLWQGPIHAVNVEKVCWKRYAEVDAVMLPEGLTAFQRSENRLCPSVATLLCVRVFLMPLSQTCCEVA